ncbi:FKBP-type peptidyl-prolyl cis-trans isomerase [Halobacteriovorax sp. ZH4_bin.1]|uniref:FKBP-type peptidyl-prolyl cis-trans isomerase n=1 Tax=unclassified Halobacteriovorax TaxID=2639665 RepID=UPI003711F054
METHMEKVSYIIGRQIGSDFVAQGMEINAEIFANAVASAMKGEASTLSAEETQRTMTEFQEHMARQLAEAANKLAEEGRAYLETNKAAEGVTTTTSGLQYKVLEAGTGATPTAESTVEVHYEGKLIDGTVFDSSFQRGQTIQFPVGGVIKGWTEALQLMKEGDSWELTIPSELAYGEHGAGAKIPPHSTLIFKVQLIKANV